MNVHKKILVRSPNWIGDQILAYPFFYELRRAFPQAHIAVVCSPWVEAVQFRNCINQVFVLNKSDQNTLWSKWKSLNEASIRIRSQGPWDLSVSLPNSFSAAWLLFRAQSRIRRGYSADGRGFLLTDKVSWEFGKDLHRSEAYMKLLPEAVQPLASAREFWGQLEAEGAISPARAPHVFEPDQAWPDADPVHAPSYSYWVLAPGSTAESRRWPIERFEALAQRIYQDTGWTGIVVGGRAEEPVAERLAQNPDLKILNWVGKGIFATSYWKLFRGAKFSVCNDSGLAHMASLCGSPVHVIWGAGKPGRTEPIGPGPVQLSLNPVSCWPCERNVCFQEAPRKLECLRGIDPDAVWKEIRTRFKV